jgi:hypothetical protein
MRLQLHTSKNNTMAVMKNARVKDSSSKSPRDDSAVSGFILKLYQMCSGAPEDVITVSAFLWSMDGRGQSGTDEKHWKYLGMRIAALYTV